MHIFFVCAAFVSLLSAGKLVCLMIVFANIKTDRIFHTGLFGSLFVVILLQRLVRHSACVTVPATIFSQ